MFDSHCHLTDLPDPLDALKCARLAGVSSLLCCGYHSASNRAVVELRERVSTLPIALGLHPWYVGESVEQVVAEIGRHQPLAIGECGLDGYDRDPEIAPLEAQYGAFEAQLELATQLEKPVTVHSRWAVNEVVAITNGFPKVRGVLHAYSGSAEQIEPLLARGWMVGLGGAMTRPGARRIRRMAMAIPLGQVLFETDAPAIGLEGVVPPLVRPHHVVAVARAFAQLRGLDHEAVEALSDANARRMFGAVAFSSGVLGVRDHSETS